MLHRERENANLRLGITLMVNAVTGDRSDILALVPYQDQTG